MDFWYETFWFGKDKRCTHWDIRLSTESHMTKKSHEGQKGQLTKAIVNLVLPASQKAYAVISR